MQAQAYTKAASYFHWMVAAPLIGSVASVLQAQNSPKEDKGKWMWRHKSLGVLTGIVVLPRMGYRLLNMGKVGYLLVSTVPRNKIFAILFGFVTLDGNHRFLSEPRAAKCTASTSLPHASSMQCLVNHLLTTIFLFCCEISCSSIQNYVIVSNFEAS